MSCRALLNANGGYGGAGIGAGFSHDGGTIIINGGTVIVGRNATASGTGGRGAHAESTGTVAVTGKAEGLLFGAFADQPGSVVTVGSAEGNTGARSNGGDVTVYGDIVSGLRGISEFANPPIPSKAGYRTYTLTEGGVNTVYVKGVAPTINGAATI